MTIYGNRGPIVRVVYLALAVLWWMLTGFGRLCRTRVVTLCYHGVTRSQRQRFRRHMMLIANRALGAAATCTTGRRGWSLPRVCVTFDDAFANLLDSVLPVMRELKVPATVFVVTENLGSRPNWNMSTAHPDRCKMTMTAEQIAQAANDCGCTFGSHSETHRRLIELPLDETQSELHRSKVTLEALLNKRVEDFAFPYGACNRELINAAFAAGYRRVFTLDPPSGVGGESGEVIGRMQMSADVWPIEFMLTTAGAYNWLPTLRRMVRRIHRVVDRLAAHSVHRPAQTLSATAPFAGIDCAVEADRIGSVTCDEADSQPGR